MESYIVYISAVGIFAYVIYSLFTKQGKGRMFGGHISETLTEEINQKKGMLTTKIKVHVVDTSQSNKSVGIEIFESAKLGASMKPITLSKIEALKLARMLNEAASKT